MSKLPKIKEYAIRYLLENKKMKPEKIASELEIDINVVKKFSSKKTTSVSKTDKTKDLMIRQTSVKKTNTVSIMTEPASQLGDEFIKTIPGNHKSTESYIFRPKNN